MLKTKNYRTRPPLGEKWRYCELCGANARLHPESEMVEYDGKWYCTPCFHFRFDFEFRDEPADIEEPE